MAKKDEEARNYLRNKDVFADAFNYSVYGGRQVIDPEVLTEQDTSALLIPFGKDRKGKAIQRYRDILKQAVLMEDGQAAYLILGIEAQSHVHYAMPVRNMLYDAMQYARQVEDRAEEYRRKGDQNKMSPSEFLSGFTKEDRLIPVITLVVLLSPVRWDGPLSIHQMLNLQDRNLLSMIPDYRIHLISPWDMNEKELKKFRTSLGTVMRFAKCSNNKEQMEQMFSDRDTPHLADEKAVRFLNGYFHVTIRVNEEGEVINVCKAWDDMRKEAMGIGQKLGEEIGEKTGRKIGEAVGRKIGEEKAVNQDARLFDALVSANRLDDFKRCLNDKSFRQQTLEKFQIS